MYAIYNFLRYSFFQERYPHPPARWIQILCSCGYFFRSCGITCLRLLPGEGREMAEIRAFYGWYTGKQGLLEEAARQIKASEGAKIQWYFAEEEVLEVVQDLFMNNGITEIELIFQAPEQEGI